MLLFLTYLLALGASLATTSEEVFAGAAVREGTSAQVPSKGSVRQQFAGYDEKMSGDGFVPIAGSERTGTLRPGATQNITLTMPSGPILIAGFCDEGCTQLEIVLRDASGEVVSEAAYDDKPVVNWRRLEAQASVAIRTPNCAKRSCSYGIKLYRLRPLTQEERDALDAFWDS